MKNTVLVSILLLALNLSLTSCGDFKPVEVTDIGAAKINKFTPEGMDLEISLKIKNPNNVRFTITETDLLFSLNGIEMGMIDLKDNIKVPANSDDFHNVHVESHFKKDLVNGIATIMTLATSKTANIHLKGNVKIRAFGFYKKRFPIELKERIPLTK